MLACAVAGALLCFSSLRETTAQNEIVKQQIEQMDAEAKRLKGEGEKVQQQLSPEQRALLIGAHKLVANKTFGWSRLFADLEQVLPGSVSASRISVANIYRENDRVKAELEFSVLSRDYQSVMTMIENMNSSGMFQAELRGQDLQKNEQQNNRQNRHHSDADGGDFVSSPHSGVNFSRTVFRHDVNHRVFFDDDSFLIGQQNGSVFFLDDNGWINRFAVIVD